MNSRHLHFGAQLLLANEVGQCQTGKTSHDGKSLQDLQCSASDLAHFWQAPFLALFGCGKTSYQEEGLEASCPIYMSGTRGLSSRQD